LIAADKIQILRWEYYFKQTSLHCLYDIFCSGMCQSLSWFSGDMATYFILY